MKRSKMWYWLFVGPSLIAFIVVVVIPMLRGIYFSFAEWDGISNDVIIVGFDNYSRLLSDSQFFAAAKFTSLFAVVVVISINVVGFILAVLVTRGIKGSNVMRSIFYMPNLIGGLILGFVWQFIFTKVFGSFGAAFGLSFLKNWLTNTETGFIGLAILMTWQMAGYMMIIYIAAIQGIPESLFEAAKIDGAGPLRRVKNIMLPLMMPAFSIGLFLTISNSFKLYDQNLALTNGGPYSSTEMLALNIVSTAFTNNDLGYAQAKAVVFLIVVGAITLTQMYLTKKREVEM